MEGVELRDPSTWVLKRAVKPDATEGMVDMKPPFKCTTCDNMIFAYSPPTVYGGYCYPCDIDKAFIAGKKRSESQVYTFRIVDEEKKTAPVAKYGTTKAPVAKRGTPNAPVAKRGTADTKGRK